jgi:hypothetical protein
MGIRRTATLAAVGIVTAAVLTAAPARADPSPAPDPNAPKCMSVGGQPFPHLQYLPCGWDWDGVNWIPPQP